MTNIINILAAAAQPAKDGQNQFSKYLPIVLVVVLMVVMVVFQIFSSKKRKKQAEQFAQTLKAGTIVMTRSGIIGEIVGFDDNAGTVILNISRNKENSYEIAVVRGAIDRVIPAESPAAKQSPNLLTEEPKKEEEVKAALPTTEDEIIADKKDKEKAEKKKQKELEKQKEKNQKEEVKE